MHTLGLFLKLCVRQALTPSTLFTVIACLSVIALLKLIVEPMLKSRAEVATLAESRKALAPRFPRASTTSQPAEFLRLLEVHRPQSLNVTLTRWEQDAYGASHPVYRLGFYLTRNDTMSGMPSKEEKTLELKVAPETIHCVAGSPPDMLRQLIASTKWYGKGDPARHEVGKRGTVSRPMDVLLPGEVRAA